MRGGDLSVEERHFRSAGSLIFVCILAVVDGLPRKTPGYLAAVTLCGLTSVGGAVLTVQFGQSAGWRDVDSYSGLRQDNADIRAIEFARAAFAREGRDVFFVIDSAGVASTFPPGARILVTRLRSESESIVAAHRYAGRVRGGIYVVTETSIAETSRGTLFLKSFTDYPLNAWERHQFGRTTVFVQAARAPA